MNACFGFRNERISAFISSYDCITRTKSSKTKTYLTCLQYTWTKRLQNRFYARSFLSKRRDAAAAYSYYALTGPKRGRPAPIVTTPPPQLDWGLRPCVSDLSALRFDQATRGNRGIPKPKSNQLFHAT